MIESPMARTIFYLFALILGLATIVPWAPDIATDYGNDDPNTILQHALWGSSFAYGKDILFTHGPWSVWYQRHYWPTTYPIFVLSHVAITAVLVMVAAGAVLRANEQWPIRFALLVVVLLVFSVDIDARLFFLLALIPIADDDQDGALMFFSAVAAFIGLVKISLLVAALLVIGFKSIDEILRQKRLPRTAIVFVVALAVFTVAAGQKLEDLLPTIGWGLEMSAGYGETMSKAGVEPGFASFMGGATLLFLALGLIFGAFVLRVEFARLGRFGWLPSLALAAVLFAAFKASFVRYDNTHAFHAFATLLPLAIVYVAWRRAPLGRSIERRGPAATIRVISFGLGAVLALGVGYAAWRDPGLYVNKTAKLALNVEAALDAFATGGAKIRGRHDAALARIRADWPMPRIEGAVTFASPTQIVGLANGMAVRPLPTINLYQAWTPGLAQILKDFFLAPDRPSDIFADRREFNGSSFWLAVWSGYEVVESVGRDGLFLHMRRRDPPRPLPRREPAGEYDVGFGQSIDLPEADGLWLSATIEPTLFGRVVEILFKKPIVRLRVEGLDGHVSDARFSPAMAPHGTMISPRLAGTMDFAKLDGPKAERVTIEVGPHSDLFYRSPIKIRIDRLTFGP